MLKIINSIFSQKDESNKEHYYFPNRSHDVILALHKLRDLSANLNREQCYVLFELVSQISENYVTSRFFHQDDMVSVTQNESEIFFPHPIPSIKFCHILCGYEEWLHNKYSLPGFVEVEANDTVVDCGAYVGGFSLSAEKLAGKVHLFEPDKHNFSVCRKNLDHSDKVKFNNCGLFNESKTIRFHISSSSVEHSILPPDDGTVTDVIEVPVMKLEDYMNEYDIKNLDFLKLEAEGVEIEIFEGLGSIKPKKLAIDISPERDGESPQAYFESKLKELGYEVRVRNNVLFAKLTG